MEQFIIDAGISDIAEKVEAQVRLSKEDGIRLFGCDDLHAVGHLAHKARLAINGRKTHYIINFHINYSNVCGNACRFCAYSRRDGEPGGYTMTADEVLASARTAAPETTEFHIVGGCHPTLPFEYYEEILSRLHDEFPDVHLQALTAVEIEHIARQAGLTVTDTLVRLRGAGLGSLPGGGAEVFDPRVRKKVCPEKLSGEGWLKVMREAHGLGIRSNATMLYGHVETIEERVDHMIALRDLQDETGGFMSFIPLSFHPANTRLSDIPPPGAIDDLLTLAVSRLVLDNFEHIKSFWIMLGVKLAQVSLFYGVDDLDGTVVHEKITHSAGAMTPEALTVDQLVHLATEAGFKPIERDTLYNIIERDRS